MKRTYEKYNWNIFFPKQTLYRMKNCFTFSWHLDYAWSRYGHFSWIWLSRIRFFRFVRRSHQGDEWPVLVQPRHIRHLCVEEGLQREARHWSRTTSCCEPSTSGFRRSHRKHELHGCTLRHCGHTHTPYADVVVDSDNVVVDVVVIGYCLVVDLLFGYLIRLYILKDVSIRLYIFCISTPLYVRLSLSLRPSSPVYFLVHRLLS